MNGPQHYKKAERLVTGDATDIAAAQVHATLAQTAAIIDGLLGNHEPGAITHEPSDWAKAIS